MSGNAHVISPANNEQRAKLFAPAMHNLPDWKALFAPNGCLLKEGDIIRRTALSHTLAKIAEEGPDAFYTVGVTPLPTHIRLDISFACTGPSGRSVGR